MSDKLDVEKLDVCLSQLHGELPAGDGEGACYLGRGIQTVLLPVPTSLGEGSQSCLSWLGGLGEGHLIWIGGEIGKDERPLKEGS